MLPLLKQQYSWQPRPEPELLATAIPDIQFPRGCLTEIVGSASSGRTTVLHAALASASSRGEMCAVVDAGDAFDPASAQAGGVRLENIVWVRCGHDAEHALKAADLLIHGGGFGIVALDLGDTPPATARRISLASWFRLRRAVENTPTVFLALARQQNAKTCASLALECARERAEWSGRRCGRLFRGFRVRAVATQRRKTCTPVFTAKAI
jgi:recombination protein RecA